MLHRPSGRCSGAGGRDPRRRGAGGRSTRQPVTKQHSGGCCSKRHRRGEERRPAALSSAVDAGQHTDTFCCSLGGWAGRTL